MTATPGLLPASPSSMAADVAADVHLLVSSGRIAMAARLLGTLPGLIQRELVECVGQAAHHAMVDGYRRGQAEGLLVQMWRVDNAERN